jgi:hypothetical protein
MAGKVGTFPKHVGDEATMKLLEAFKEFRE